MAFLHFLKHIVHDSGQNLFTFKLKLCMDISITTNSPRYNFDVLIKYQIINEVAHQNKYRKFEYLLIRELKQI